MELALFLVGHTPKSQESVKFDNQNLKNKKQIIVNIIVCVVANGLYIKRLMLHSRFSCVQFLYIKYAKCNFLIIQNKIHTPPEMSAALTHLHAN